MSSKSISNVRVELDERSYDIKIGRGLLARTAEFITPLGLGSNGVIVTDSHVSSLYIAPLQESLSAAGIKTTVLTIPAGEASKSLRQASRLLEKLPRLRLDRKSFVIALGGGVVGDLAGFLAATYLRGIYFIQIPTSLLALVDSSVGGKVGVNLPQGKNLVGSFYQPQLVLADIDTLRTLPKRELRAGFAEVIKYGAIYDKKFFAWLEANHKKVMQLDPDAVIKTVRRCCEIKAEVVSADEYEGGLRAILNFGHTIGHAMEALSDYIGLLHGEAISMGMCCAAKLSVTHTGLSDADAQRIIDLIKASGLPTKIGKDYEFTGLQSAMQLDKKAMGGRLRFILLEKLGQAVLSDAVTNADIEEVVNVCR